MYLEHGAAGFALPINNCISRVSSSATTRIASNGVQVPQQDWRRW